MSKDQVRNDYKGMIHSHLNVVRKDVERFLESLDSLEEALERKKFRQILHAFTGAHQAFYNAGETFRTLMNLLGGLSYKPPKDKKPK